MCTELSGRASARTRGREGRGASGRGGGRLSACVCSLRKKWTVWPPPRQEPDPRCRAQSPSGGLPNASLPSARGPTQGVAAAWPLLAGALSTVWLLPRSPSCPCSLPCQSTAVPGGREAMWAGENHASSPQEPLCSLKGFDWGHQSPK